MSSKFKGILLCFILAIPSYFMGMLFPVIGGPVFSIIFGIILSYLACEKLGTVKEGINFVSKKVLQYAVIVLGFGLNLQMIIRVGRDSLPIILSTISVSLILAFIISKFFDIPSKISILIGVGSSICGGSAIAATAPVIDADSGEIAQAISVIFFFNLIAALIFPTFGDMLGLSNHGFALFAGTAINDTSSVTAAASSWDSIHNTGSEVLDFATIVKLTRTLAIIPITFFLSVYNSSKLTEKNKFGFKSSVPKFIIFFVLCSVFTTVVEYGVNSGVLGSGVSGIFQMFFDSMKILSKFLIVMAMGAIGLNTDIVKLIKTGKKPLVLGLVCWIGIIITSISIQAFLKLI